MRHLHLLPLILLTGCGKDSPVKPVAPATSPGILLENLSRSLNEMDIDLYDESFSRYFMFVDEPTGIEEESSRFFLSQFDEVVYRLGVYEETDVGYGCMQVCGLLQMRLIRYQDCDYKVNDETCLTACPRIADGLWYLTEWRTLRSIPPRKEELGVEPKSWTEVRRIAVEIWLRDMK